MENSYTDCAVATFVTLSEKSLALLDHIKSGGVDASGNLQDVLVKDVFKKILSGGDVYKIEEIDNWLHANLSNIAAIERILNVAHYQKAKHDASNPLKMMDDGCGCGGDC